MRPELQDIVDEVSRVLRKPATLEDRRFNLVAFGSHDDGIDEVRQHTILRRQSTAEVRSWFEQFGIADSDVPVRIPSSPEHGVLGRLCLPARWHGVTYGYLWLLDPDEEIDDDALPELLDLAGRAGAMLAQQARVRDDLGYKLRDLLSADPEIADRAAGEIDDDGLITRGTPVAVVELRVAAAGPFPVNLSQLPRSVLVSTADDHATLLVPVGSPGSSPQDTGTTPARDVAERLLVSTVESHATARSAELVAGIGAPRPDLAHARGSWQEARLAARVAQAVPALRPVAGWPELGVYRLLGCGSDSTLAGAVLDHAVLRLLDHGDGDLIATARAYLDHAGNVQQTAAALNVHRQTVYYRLERIEQVTGLDLARGDQQLLLHLGLTLAPLLTSR
ncbi:PucR family transcriptional regulator [Phytoactinopolyspora halotolerans]|nr:PucR family transcriptional regulator [Phytoactinopolyspora halotolerans]